mmetsp:Transcript_62987/g.144945  ORF Transcript_62987/g.144945 Transcript_62987/m.144945 type:complete len:633 (-) Transcript_62987:470-2368(-)
MCLVTHFHLDHSGALPYFVNRTHFQGKVLMTHATRAICPYLWHDYARVSRVSEDDHIFTREDIDKTMDCIEVVDFHQTVTSNGISVTAYGAGHVLGACMFLVDIGGIRVLYTGDYSQDDDRHLPKAEVPPTDVHVLIVEATYGVQAHEPREQREQRLVQYIHQVVRMGGRCLLPVFALGRAQEILLILDEYWANNPDLHQVPVYYFSPMANKCMRVFETYTNMCSQDVQDKTNNSENPWDLKFVKHLSDQRRITEAPLGRAPCVVMAAPGMLQNGPSRDLFEQWALDRKNGVVFTGYCVQGTLAYDLRSEPDTFQMSDGRKMNIRAGIKFVSFSAHSDYNQTHDFITRLETQNVVLVHGEETQMAQMQVKLREDFPHVNVTAPRNCETIHYHFPAVTQLKIMGSLAGEVTKRRKLDDEPVTLSGVVVSTPDLQRTFLAPEELPQFTRLEAVEITQRQHIPLPSDQGFERVVAVLTGFLKPPVEVDGALRFCDALNVRREPAGCILEWKASPISDIVADTASLAILEWCVRANVAPILSDDRAHARGLPAVAAPVHLEAILRTYLTSAFGAVEVQGPGRFHMAQVVSKPGADPVAVTVDCATKKVTCEDESLKKRVVQGISRCLTTFTMAKPF